MKTQNLWFSMVLVLAVSCKDDEVTTPPAEDTASADEGNDIQTEPDTAIDTATEQVEDTQTEPDVELPTCFEEDRERLVGTECARHTDRVCLDNSHCREGIEECEFEGDEETGTCTYQIPDPLECPGSPSCPEGDTAPLRAAFAMRTITPLGFEEGKADDPMSINEDGLFVGDTYDTETYWDCGRDMICPDDDDYTGPDEDGSEGNEDFEGAWIAGFDHSRPAFRCPPELLGDDCDQGPACCAHELAHDDIWARGVMFEQGDSKVAMISLDLVGFFYSDIERIFARVPEDMELDLLIISSTHTHEAPDTVGQWGVGFLGGDLPDETGVDAAHMAHVHDQVLALLAEANDNLAAVDVYAASVDTGSVGMAAHDTRDPWIFDDNLAVVKIITDGGDPTDPTDTVGVLINWGNHPEAISDRNPYISSDFPHYARYYVENGFPANDDPVLEAIPGVGGPVAYFSAAVGGLITPLRGREAMTREGVMIGASSWPKVDAMGQQLALATFEALKIENLQQMDETLSFGKREFMNEIANLQFQLGFMGLELFDREVYNWRHSDTMWAPDLPQVVTAVAKVQIGGLTFVTVPGEVFPETLTGGFQPGDTTSTPVRGDPLDLQCEENLLPPGETPVDATHPCMVSPSNPNPPDVAEAPNGGFVRDALPGDVIFVLGLGMDELGYLVPPYDFELLEGAEYVGEPDGDHYEETNSTGPNILMNVLDNLELLFDLDVELFARE